MTDTKKSDPLLVRTRALLVDAETLLGRPSLSGAPVEFLILKTRHLISGVFGDDSPQLTACPVPGTDASTRSQHDRVRVRMPILASMVDAMDRVSISRKIFVGHGGSPQWLLLKDFLGSKLKLDVEEFNVVPTAGIHTTERLHTMLREAGMAFLIMTAEDTLDNGTVQARPNVIHEVGLFQGYLGTRRAIVLLEEGCAACSNLDGLTTVRFPKNDITARFEKVRGVLEREGFLAA